MVQVWWSEPAVVCLHLAGPLVFERELSLLSRRVYTGPFGELGGFHHFLHPSRGPGHVLWPCVVGGSGGLRRPGRRGGRGGGARPARVLGRGGTAADCPQVGGGRWSGRG